MSPSRHTASVRRLAADIDRAPLDRCKPRLDLLLQIDHCILPYIISSIFGKPALRIFSFSRTRMKKFGFILLAIFFASILQSTVADGSTTSKGFPLNERARKTIKRSDVADEDVSVMNLRQWNAEEYEAIMSNLSGQNSLRGIYGAGSLRHRQMQQSQSFQQTKRVTKWQFITLVIVITATVGLGYYACSLRYELSALEKYKEYLPLGLGYKLFPETDIDDDTRINGVELR